MRNYGIIKIFLTLSNDNVARKTNQLENYEEKTFKAFFAFAAIAAGVLGTYKTYVSYITDNKSEADLLMQENVLALTESPYWISDRAASPEFCTLYIYVNGQVKLTYETEQPSLEASGTYTKTKTQGIRNKCPRKGSGCEPYSCHEHHKPGN